MPALFQTPQALIAYGVALTLIYRCLLRALIACGLAHTPDPEQSRKGRDEKEKEKHYS
jgi:hypothetical protein